MCPGISERISRTNDDMLCGTARKRAVTNAKALRTATGCFAGVGGTDSWGLPLPLRDVAHVQSPGQIIFGLNLTDDVLTQLDVDLHTLGIGEQHSVRAQMIV